MAVRDIFKISRKTFFNPKGWLDYDFLKYQTTTLYDALKSMFTPTAPETTESFEEAMKRLNLTEQDVINTANSYRLYALLFALIGLAIFAYAFYLLFAHHTISGWILGLAVSALFFVYGYKYDFWSFQMRRRKLGATFGEWKRYFLGEKGGSS